MPERQIVTNETLFPIQPKDIGTGGHYFDAFDHWDTEVSAYWIIRFCQERGGWYPFTRPEIEKFYQENSRFKDFDFNRLIMAAAQYEHGERTMVGGGWIVIGDEGKYCLTDEFITRCFSSSRRLKPVQIM